MHIFLIVAALLWQPLTTVSGQILDREGKPLAGAQIVYKGIGIVDEDINALPGGRSETPKMRERGGRTYTIKSDKKGSFTMVGVQYGVYDVQITGPDGAHLYSGKKIVGNPADPSSQNILNVDLSTVYRGPVEPGGGTNLAAGKKSKEQLELIRQENANAAKINRLIVRYHAELELQDWPAATSLIEELIKLDTERWEFYQNLGTLQSNQMHYEQAVQAYAKGVEVARKTLANATDTDHALTTIGDMLLAEADCYNRLEKADEAVALYDKAAATYPHPYIAHLRACSTLMNYGKADLAVEKCNQAVADDLGQWEPYQALGSIYTADNKTTDAIDAYEKGSAAAQKALEKQPDAARTRIGLGQMLNAEGNLLVQLKKYEDATGIFARAAESAPYPAMPYFNLCATDYNLKHFQDALTACDHAISSDSRMAGAYYIKAVILFGQGHVEHGRYAVPPGTTEALNKYLEYEPAGEHAGAVREMINQLNKPAESTYQRSPR